MATAVAACTGAEERKATFETEGVKIVEEEAADTAGFGTVLQIKIIVAPLFPRCFAVGSAAF